MWAVLYADCSKCSTSGVEARPEDESPSSEGMLWHGTRGEELVRYNQKLRTTDGVSDALIANVS